MCPAQEGEWVLAGGGSTSTSAIGDGLSHDSRALKRHFALCSWETFTPCKERLFYFYHFCPFVWGHDYIRIISYLRGSTEESLLFLTISVLKISLCEDEKLVPLGVIFCSQGTLRCRTKMRACDIEGIRRYAKVKKLWTYC